MAENSLQIHRLNHGWRRHQTTFVLKLWELFPAPKRRWKEKWKTWEFIFVNRQCEMLFHMASRAHRRRHDAEERTFFSILILARRSPKNYCRTHEHVQPSFWGWENSSRKVLNLKFKSSNFVAVYLKEMPSSSLHSIRHSNLNFMSIALLWKKSSIVSKCRVSAMMSVMARLAQLFMVAAEADVMRDEELFSHSIQVVCAISTMTLSRMHSMHICGMWKLSSSIRISLQVDKYEN